MRHSIRIAGEDIHILMTTIVFAVGIAGGYLAKLVGAPLPMLLGSVTAVGAISIFGFRPGGRPPRIPFWLRNFFIPIVGLSIGSAFTPGILAEMRTWWPSLLALLFYIPLAHYIGYRTFVMAGRISRTTAYYGAVPGGLLVCIAMGEESGADGPMLTALQFLRLILTVMLVPLAFTIMSGTTVGTAAGAVIGHPESGLAPSEIFWQAALAVAGYFGGRRLGMPAYMITGPILASVDEFTLTLQGRGGHAAKPQETVDTTVMMSHIICALQTVMSRNVDPVLQGVLSITSAETSSKAFNVIPDRAEVRGTVRTHSPEVRALIPERLQAIVDGIAQTFGGTADLSFHLGVPVTINDDAAADFARLAAETVSGAGSCEEVPLAMGGEDFSFMLQERPGAMIRLGNGPSAGLHHPEYDFNDEAIPTGISWFAEMIEQRMPVA